MWQHRSLPAPPRSRTLGARFARLWSVGLLCLLWSAGAQAQTLDKRGGELLYGELESVTRFNPYKLEGARGASNRIFSLIYERLFRYVYEEEAYKAVLAESWSVDDSTITVKLRDGVLWHSGKPFTAADVIFTYKFIKLIAPDQVRSKYDVVSLEAVDPLTIRATFTGPLNDSLWPLTAWILPAHRFKDFIPLPRSQRKHLEEEPEGTGPYQFVTRTIDGHVIMAVNEKYWGEQGNIETLKMKKMTDPNQEAQLALLQVHKLMVQVPPNEIVHLKESELFLIEPYSSHGFYAFAYNNKHPILEDKRVRRALTYATDREQILKQWFNEQGEIIAGPFSSSSVYYDPRLKMLPYAPDSARALLGQAGYRDRNGDGFLQSSDGSKLSLELINFVDGAASKLTNQQMASSFKHYLEEIGVEVKIVNLDLDDYQKRLRRPNGFEIALVKWTFDPKYDVRDLFETKAIGGNNIVQYSNTEVDEFIKRFNQAKDPEIRKEYIKTMQRIIAAECPYTFLLSEYRNVAFHRSLRGTRFDPYYFFPYFPQWYIDPRYREE